MISLERANQDRPVTMWSLVGVLLVPILVSLGFLGATWNSTDRLHRVEAAVVNLDEMVELNGQPVPLGRQLAAGLVERRDDNLHWVLADEKNAKRGLESGRFAAVVTIPKDFSANATSFSGPADQARHATINVQTSEMNGVADSTVARIIAETAKSAVNQQLTETYLDNIYLGFNDMHQQFVTLADGSRQLADGAQQLSDGLGQSATGSRELATGTHSYVDGVRQAADGGAALADGLNQLSANSGQLNSGATQLANGLGLMADQTKDMPAQTRQLADGAGQLAGGVQQLVDGVQQIPAMMRAKTITQPDGTTTPGLIAGTAQYVDGVDQLVDGIEPVFAALDKIDTSKIDQRKLEQASADLTTAQAQAKVYASRLDQASQAPCPAIDGLTASQQELVCAEWAKQQAVLRTPDPRLGGASPVQWAVGFANNQDLNDAVNQTAATLPQLPQLISQAQSQGAQIRQLKPAGQQILGGLDQLASGIEAQRPQMQQAADGAAQLADGTRQLADAVPALTSGIRQSADGAAQLADGVRQYTGGVDQAATGAQQLSSGLGQLADGGAQLTSGADQLADGLQQADEGGRELAKGQKQMADGIAEGKDKVPTYSDSERQNLKQVVATPVSGDLAGEMMPEKVATSLIMILSLWLGALATYLVVQTVSTRTLTSSRPTWWLVGRSIAPGAAIATVQSVALVAIGQIVLHLSAPKAFGVMLMLMLGGAVFVAVNHALVAWFGGVGRLVSVAMVTLTAAAGITSAVPAFFDVVTPLLPLTPVLHGVRAIMTDSPGIIGAVGMSVLWLVVALVASIAAVMKKRSLTPERFESMLPKRLVHA